jgi:D-alanyl-D-alanine carboxypeptidase
MHNTNGLIGRYPGANGFKTGFVCASGFNLVAMATKGGRTLVAVVLGASSGGDRVVRAAQLLDQGFSTWGSGNQTLRNLPTSGESSAPNMRQAICGRRRPGIILTDDADYGGAILADSFSGESMAGTSAVGFFQVGNGSSAFQPGRSGGGSAIRSAGGGRAILGPRVGIAAIPVHLGRAPGSTAVALGPGSGAAKARAVAAAAPTLRGTAIATPPNGRGDPLPPGIRGGSPLPASATALAPAQTVTVTPIETVRPAQAAAIRPNASNLRVEPAGAPMDLMPLVARETRPAAEAGIKARPPQRAQQARADSGARRPAAQTRPLAAPARVQPASPRPKPVDDE